MFNLDLLLQQELDELKKHGLYRTMNRIDSMQGPVVIIDNKEVILLSSNNYLGLASHSEVIQAQIEAAREFGSREHY
jgi:7-keto-8-aminopelargonate synthetase-like enzyme